MYEIFEKLMKENNVTAYKVSKETGIATSTLTDWKKQRSTPKQDKLQKIADYFNVSIDYLTGKSEYRNFADEFDAKYDTEKLRQEAAEFDSDLKRIERARSKMTPKDKEKMMKVLEASFDEYFDD